MKTQSGMSIKSAYLASVGEFFHLYNRGVNRDLIFFERRNYDYFLQKLWHYLDSSGVDLIAYCLMPNHFHFLVRQQIPDAVSKVIGNTCNGYVKAVNKAFGRSGHLFESKYKMKHVNQTSYLSYLTSYIHMNPVSARLVTLPEEWEYSSCREYLGKRSNRFIDSNLVLELFQSRENYREFMLGSRRDVDELANYLFEE